MKKILLPAILLVTTLNRIDAQSDYYFPGSNSFDPGIPTPEQFFGYPIGDHHTRYDRIVEYFNLLAESSDRASFEIFGYTEELRPQVILTITSPANHNRLDEIRKMHLSLSDPYSKEKPDLASLPLIIQLGYNVHGNEASGGEASLLTAYYLVASNNEEMAAILDNSVIFIEPVLNPDGRERFTSWVNMNKSYRPVADPAEREHTEAWPGGRTNHYWFDLNRDWLPLSQLESRNRMERFQQWRPNVITDHHEMGTSSTFFFEPTKKGSENPIVTGENYIRLNNLFAASYAKALDEIDHYYDSGNSFDNSYPGYGSSYADVNGGLAILFEQASTRGLMQETDLGYTLHFSTGIMNQLTGALTTVRTAVENRIMLNDYMVRFYRDAMTEAARDPVKAYVFGDSHDLGRTMAFVDLLLRHGIEVRSLDQDVRKFPREKSFVVPVQQPQYKLVRTMFEANLEFPDSIFYDATAWAMVYAYGIPFEGVSKMPATGKIITNSNIAASQPEFSSFGYIIDWSEYYSPRALNKLLEKGIRVKAAWEPFSIKSGDNEIDLGRGSILVPVPYQDITAEKVYEIITEISDIPGIRIYPVNTAVTTQGPWMGNGSFKTVENQKILMFTGDGISSSVAGTIWHLLDTRMNIAVTRSDLSRFSRLNLNRYTTIIMPEGNYSQLGDQDIIRLGDWVSSGGNLIAIGSAASYLDSRKIINIEIARRENNLPDRIDYDKLRSESGKQAIGGIYCRADLDITHPLGFGYKEREITVYRDHSLFIKPVAGESSNVVIYPDNPVISGFVTTDNRSLLGGTVSLASLRKGRGHITLFIDDPTFRGCWYGTDKMLMNAIFFGGGI